MKKIMLDVKVRKDLGKELTKKLRTSGIIPAVVYKKGKDTLHVQVVTKDLFHVLHTSAGENAIITLKMDEKDGEKTVIIKDIQYHPIKDNVLHVDFQEISLTEKITVNVAVVLKGEAVGVKAEGGILEHITKELHVECLPTDIPEKIEINVEAMKIGDVVHVKELSVPSGVKVLNDPDQIVVAVAAPKAEEVAAEGAEGLESQEPEVITERKPKEGEEAEGKEEEPKKEEKKEHKEK